jgi:hypothetical protein
VVESGGLENRCTFGYPGFESLPLRIVNNTKLIRILFINIFCLGEVSEWLKEHAWKACVVNATAGSNPALSALGSHNHLPIANYQLSINMGP